MTDDIPAAVPASTLVLFRDRELGPPELLMVERSTGMAFAGGAVVFPGGRVDADDHVLATRHGHLAPDEAAARIAAIRETIEESLIPVGLVGNVGEDWLEAARTHLHARKPFSTLLDADGLALDLDVLIPFARWCPKHREARVFDTRFYIARAPADLPAPIVDDTENVRTFWAAAQEVIGHALEDRVKVIFPTMRNLERLAQFESFDAAASHARDIPVQTISPFMEERDGERHLCIPEGLGYPVTSESFGTVKSAFSLNSAPPNTAP